VALAAADDVAGDDVPTLLAEALLAAALEPALVEAALDAPLLAALVAGAALAAVADAALDVPAAVDWLLLPPQAASKESRPVEPRSAPSALRRDKEREPSGEDMDIAGTSFTIRDVAPGRQCAA